ncbi:hypothetical protein KY312_01475 [Candidatus Woesearchaeota archaeon]|nr:hypothetical protein [Candidatus Woesearchaeota archaeon]
MKTKIFFAFLVFLVFSNLAYAEFCDLRAVLYYGSCNKDGDVVVHDEQDNVIAQSLYGENSGCYNGVYSIVVSGGPSTGCILQENEVASFYLGGTLAGATKWSSTILNKQFDLNIERIVYDVEGDDIIVEDLEGSDISKTGTGSGGGSITLTAVKKTDSGDVPVAKFNVPAENNDTIELEAPDSGEVYLNLPQAESTEILVPALKSKGSVIVCTGSKDFKNCKNEFELRLGETKHGVSLDSEYKYLDGQKYYVIRGLKEGIAKENTGFSSTTLAVAGIVFAAFLIFIYLIKRR